MLISKMCLRAFSFAEAASGESTIVRYAISMSRESAVKEARVPGFARTSHNRERQMQPGKDRSPRAVCPCKRAQLHTASLLFLQAYTFMRVAGSLRSLWAGSPLFTRNYGYEAEPSRMQKWVEHASVEG